MYGRDTISDDVKNLFGFPNDGTWNYQGGEEVEPAQMGCNYQRIQDALEYLKEYRGRPGSPGASTQAFGDGDDDDLDDEDEDGESEELPMDDAPIMWVD